MLIRLRVAVLSRTVCVHRCAGEGGRGSSHPHLQLIPRHSRHVEIRRCPHRGRHVYDAHRAEWSTPDSVQGGLLHVWNL